jgi:hypothetical protein
LFQQHPEFFTIQGENISLVWRRSRERNYDTFERRLLSRDEAMHMAAQDHEETEVRLSRPPLDTAELSKLVDIAIDIHEQEIKHQQERRWWIAAFIATAGVIITLVTKL